MFKIKLIIYKKPRFAVAKLEKSYLFCSEGYRQAEGHIFLVGKAYLHFFYMVVYMTVENISKQSREMWIAIAEYYCTCVNKISTHPCPF